MVDKPTATRLPRMIRAHHVCTDPDGRFDKKKRHTKVGRLVQLLLVGYLLVIAIRRSVPIASITLMVVTFIQVSR
jgi:hypothetical protein